ncbi:UvrD-helicase domain-containing protein [Cellulomonas alba]|uniref:RecBCD enzyme subunit RecB n=1 Tax=Cellulomonas alba TaxID=3053467 RepID=A0ABT7SC02_9CELL|nr:UvrD-helicase domain-containing protein [Cellulomonas alba]MDM7853666.1 UvrD-helicase domain-containing protein [Cellulomonas alba]
MTSPVFDVAGPLPVGTVVLEASAGTGKTTTIASLAARYVAEGAARLPELMLVTFGRMATSELRDRVRARLVEVERALRASTPQPTDDEVVALLAAVDDDERLGRADRLARALAEFDAATITTTHGFCQQMLATLGTVGDVDHDATLVPDVATLEAEVVDDLYLRKYVGSEQPLVTVATARQVAHEAISDHSARLEPEDAPADTPGQLRYGLAAAARAEFVRRKRAQRVLDYDDLLVVLRDALADPATGAAAAARVRERYTVVMVDEFQDTDPVQWEILRTAFHGHRTLILIGDPKQAIYAFRGADVATYLRAAADAQTQTLTRNWRADPAVLAGLAPILEGTALGDPRIVVHPVSPGRSGRRLNGGPGVIVRQITRSAVGAVGPKAPAVWPVRELLHRDVAAQVVRTLSRAQLRDEGGWRPVEPGDIAILARKNREAVAVRDALADVGVPAVVTGLASVFNTAAAQDWLLLLSALARPALPGAVAAAALTPFLGWDATRLALADDKERDELADRLRAWSRVLADRGVVSIQEAAAADGMRARLLERPDGERRLTDLRHVGEALHAAATGQGMGAAALLEWLRARIDDAESDYAEERSRRLETDAAAVQVITVHASKGLQFPVVMVPYLWDRWTPRTPETLQFHSNGERTLHVGGAGSPRYTEARAAWSVDDAGETLRLAYVALTRATSQVVLWWAPSSNSPSGPLTRLLQGSRAADGTPQDSVPTTTDVATEAVLRDLVARAPGHLHLEVVQDQPPTTRWTAPLHTAPTLAVDTLDRPVDSAWRRTSFSALTAPAHGGAVRDADTGVATEPDVAGLQDEPDAPSLVPPAAAAVTPDEAMLRTLPSPMAELPAGTTFGTVVHRALELFDTSATDTRAELTLQCDRAGTVPGLAPAKLADALLPAVSTPLGPLARGAALRDFATRDRLAELDFELPLAGGDRGGRPPASLRDVAALLRTHLPADDVFAGYADRLADDGLPPGRLRGYLTGSIDAVLRIPADAPGGHRYLVVDYKTNRLGPVDEPLSAWHYRPEAMSAAMLDQHYPLQLMLYSVALHRYLRWRVPPYDPDVHLGGGLYLFLRGMLGPEAPVVAGTTVGVMAWRPPAALVVALSDLLDGRGSTR